MAKIRRNGPCPCGSGSKAKRCCYGNDEAREIHHLPAELCEEVIPNLKRLDRDEFRALFDQLLYLPEIDTSLQQRLGILTPDLDRAIGALEDDDVEVFEEVLYKVVADIDSPDRRLELAQAVLTLRDEGRVPATSPQPPFSNSTARNRRCFSPRWPNRWPSLPAIGVRPPGSS